MNTVTTHLPGSSRLTPLREGALVLTVLACLPYLALKTAWILGSELGIPADSALLDHETTMRFANGLTFLMDATAIALAFALARSWGRRIPAWLIAGPAWIATGLLAPIVLAFPLQAVLGVVGGGSEPAPDFLEPWVFTVVYGGFSLQALGLGVLFVLHSIDRWGHLWHGPVAGLPALPTSSVARLSVVGAAVVATVPLVVHIAWASGASWLRDEGVSGEQAMVQGVFALLTVSGLCGAAVLVRGRSAVPAGAPLVAAWVGSATVTAWGLWMMFGTAMTDPSGQVDTPAGMVVVFGLAATSGAMLLVTGAHLFAGWSAERRELPVPV
ncbi:hypothetical protein [Aeromicrobium sp. CTD01-1L150]|uniref:hypothetical protein n=1 Tax=Aeromicrobium sp. CTD01-1L150 TaxID=3341830 RepID=UPI0035BEFF65